jgi:methylenetetrahydrofolate reductase (NADPH)
MIEKLKSSKPCLSVEVFPPKKEGHLEGVIRALKGIGEVNPDFVSVTYGANGSGSDKTADVASVAIDAFGMKVLAHLTAVNMTREKLESLIETYRRKDVKNLLVLRGDLVPESQFFDFRYASDLALYIKKHYPDFTLIGACYPAGHPESNNLDEDIDIMRLKVDSGVDAFISQLFLDNDTFYNFLDKVNKNNLNLPISAGIMPIINNAQISRVVSMCGAPMPTKFAKMVANNTENLYESGIQYAIKQIDDLVKQGQSNIHLYSMNKADVAKKVFKNFVHIR